MPERMEDLRAGQMVGKRGSLEMRKKADSASNAPVEISVCKVCFKNLQINPCIDPDVLIAPGHY